MFDISNHPFLTLVFIIIYWQKIQCQGSQLSKQTITGFGYSYFNEVIVSYPTRANTYKTYLHVFIFLLYSYIKSKTTCRHNKKILFCDNEWFYPLQWPARVVINQSKQWGNINVCVKYTLDLLKIQIKIQFYFIHMVLPVKVGSCFIQTTYHTILYR